MIRGRFRQAAVLAAIIAAALAGLAAWELVEGRNEAAREAERERAVQPPQRVSTVHGEQVITLDPAAQRDAGVETLALHDAPQQERLRAYANVLDLEKLTGLTGSLDRARAQRDIAQARLAASRTGFERARKLFQDRQNISAAQLEAAEAAFRVDQAGLAAAQSELRSLALSATQAWGPALGAAIVDDTELLQRLVARQEVLLQVTLRPGQAIEEPPANAAVQLDSGSHLALRFVSAATKTDPRLQGLSFFFTAPADSLLLAGMSVVALLPTGPPLDGAVVPASAIIWEAGRAWAYFRSGPDIFARRAVATDRPAPEGGYIVQGIANGAEVVVRGAQMLLSEEFRAQTRAGGSGDQD